MLKLFMRIWMLTSSPTVYRSLCLVICLSMVSHNMFSYDGGAVGVDVAHLRMALKKVLRSRVGVEAKKKICAILKKGDSAEIEAREVLDLIPAIRQYLDQKINKLGGRAATKVQIRAIAYLSALKNAFESVGFDEPKYRSFSKHFSDEVDQVFEQLPQHYSVLAIRVPNFGATSQGSHAVSGKQLLPCLNFALEKCDRTQDQLLTIESSVDSLEPAGDVVCSKLDVIITDEQTLESSIDLITSKLDVINTTVDGIDSNVGRIESSVDAFCVLNSKIDVIDSETSAIDDVAIGVDMTFEAILSKVDILDNAIDIIGSTISKIDIIAFKSDQNLDDACDIWARLSALLAPNGDLDQIDSCIDVIKSDIDVVIAALEASCDCVTLLDTQTIVADKNILSLDWSVADTFLAIGLSAVGGAADAVEIWEWDGVSTLTFMSGIDPNSKNVESIRWHPTKNWLAVSTANFSMGSEVFIYEVDWVTGAFTLLSFVDIGGEVRSVSWHPSGSYLAVGTTTSMQEVRVFPVDDSGIIGTPVIVSSSNTHVAHNDGCDWDTTGSYLAVAFEQSVPKPELVVYEFNDQPSLSLTEVATINIATSILAVDWNPTCTQYLAIGLEGNTSITAQVVEFDPAAGTLVTITSIENLNKSTLSVDWSSSGECLAIGTDSPNDDKVRIVLFDKGDLTILQTCAFDVDGAVGAVRWSRGGKSLAVGGGDTISIFAGGGS